MTFDWTLKLGDIAIVCATFFGPIAAVQAQKAVERVGEKRQRRLTIFRTLMATRAASVSTAHVEALNAIPIEFYGNDTKLKEIIDSWKAYLDYLSQKGVAPEVWKERRFDLFIDLLEKISQFLGYKFNRVEIRKEIYSPIAHEELQTEQEIIRRGLARLFKGETALPMDVKAFPADPHFIQNQMELQKRLLKCIDENGNLKIALGPNYPSDSVGSGILGYRADK